MLTKWFGIVKNLDGNIVDKFTKAKRLSICQSCPKYRKDFKLLFKTIPNKPQCGKCKCAINDKIIWENEKCPLKRWT